MITRKTIDLLIFYTLIFVVVGGALTLSFVITEATPSEIFNSFSRDVLEGNSKRSWNFDK